MSEPDPMDKTYAAAEAMLDDEAARAARRAAVLGAVARDAGDEPGSVPMRAKPRSFAPHAGWLTAAAVAGVGVFLTFQLAPPPPMPMAEAPATAQREVATAPPAPMAAEPVAPANKAAPAPAPAPTAPTPRPAPAFVSPDSIVAEDVGRFPDRNLAEAMPAPPPPPPPAPAVARSMSDSVDEVVVTGHRAALQAAPSRKRAAVPAMEASAEPADAPPSPAALTARLHAAASAGRLAELRTLLSQGADPDAADDAGDTALIKAVRARRTAAAAVLRAYGADIDLKNRAGRSAREMAEARGDAELNQALGLEP